MTQLGDPYWKRDVPSIGGLSTVALSPTTDDKKLTIGLRGAGPSLSFQEDLALGRSFQAPKFEESLHESVFSNIDVYSGKLQLKSSVEPKPAPPPTMIAGLETSVQLAPQQRDVVDLLSPATEPFMFSRLADTTFSRTALDLSSLRTLEAEERECEEEQRDELRRERGLWKYARR